MNAATPIVATTVTHAGVDVAGLADKVTIRNLNFYYGDARALKDISVRLYRNKNFEIEYYGLMIWDKLGWYASRKVMVDIHKQEQTNGCIFIVDSDTPPLSDPARLNLFEPQIIQDIQGFIGARTKDNIGTMQIIEIK